MGVVGGQGGGGRGQLDVMEEGRGRVGHRL